MKKMRTVFSFLIVLFLVSTQNVTTSDAQDSHPYIYWTDRDGGKIQRATFNGTNVQNLVTGLGRPVGIELDLAAGKMYWTDRDNHNFQDPNARAKILRANLDGSNIETLVTGEALILLREEITLDLTAGKMYWTDIDSRAAGRIQRANLDGSNIETLVTEVHRLRGIDLDLTDGKMYWADSGSSKIQRANLDGTNIETLVTGLSSPHHIALDLSREQIYWATDRVGKIQRANFNGSNLEDFVVGLGCPIGIAFDSLNDKVYWADSHTHKIQRANLDGTNVEDVVTGLTNPLGIAIPISQPSTVPQRDVTSTSNTTVSLSPSPVQSPAVNERLTFNLNIASGERVAGYQATAQFDTTALRYVSSANSNYLPAGAFFRQPVVEGNLVKITAASVAGESNGNGTLATLTFEGIAVKASSLTLSAVLLSNSDGETFRPQVQGAEITASRRLRGDVNADGAVNVLDMILVASRFEQTGENTADLNDDKVVNIADLVLVAGALGGDDDANNPEPVFVAVNLGAPPSLLPLSFELLTATDVNQWLSQAQGLTLADATSRRGVLFLEQLLLALLPKETTLLANYPNPFNPETWIPYQLSNPVDVTVRIYSISGSLVRHLPFGYQAAGIYHGRSRAVYWDGKNEVGEPVASGVYFYTLSAGDFVATRKMLIRK